MPEMKDSPFEATAAEAEAAGSSPKTKATEIPGSDLMLQNLDLKLPT